MHTIEDLQFELHGGSPEKGQHIKLVSVFKLAIATGLRRKATQPGFLPFSSCTGLFKAVSGCLGSRGAAGSEHAQPRRQQGGGPGAHNYRQHGPALAGSNHWAHHCRRHEAQCPGCVSFVGPALHGPSFQQPLICTANPLQLFKLHAFLSTSSAYLQGGQPQQPPHQH